MKRETIPLEALTDLRRQARRRLIGSIVLLSIAVMVLWNVISEYQPQNLERNVFVQSTPDASNVDLSKMDELVPKIVVQTPVVDEVPKVSTHSSVPMEKSNLPATPPAVIPSPASPAALVDAKKNIRADVAVPTTPSMDPVAKSKSVHPRDILEGRFDPDAEVVSADQNVARAKNLSAGKGKTNSIAKQTWVIQLAALSDETKINSLREKLKQVGVAAQFSDIETSKGKVTRIRVGPFTDKAQASAMMKRLSQQGLSGLIIAQQSGIS